MPPIEIDGLGDKKIPLLGTATGAHATPDTLTAALVDGTTVTLAKGALHARSPAERNIVFHEDPNAVVDGKTYYICWIALAPVADDRYGYAGVVSSPMVVDHERKVGYKDFAKHVNDLEAATKGHTDLSGLSAAQRQALKQLLIDKGPEPWANSSEAFKAHFER